MRKEFDFEKFKEKKIAVHCKTEEEAKDFCKKMHEQGMKWKNGDPYIEEQYYDVYQEKMCYYADGEYSDLDYAKEKGYIVLEWSDYMQKEFTKADLKDGMAVEYKNGMKRLVVGDTLIGQDSWLDLRNINYDLKHYGNDCERLDIVKVYKIKCPRRFGTILDDDNLELIWQRTETKRMTAEEMRVKLEELTGEKIEIVEEPNEAEMRNVISKYCDKQGDCFCCQFVRKCPFNESANKELVKQCYEKVV